MKYNALQAVTVGRGALIHPSEDQLARMTGLVVETEDAGVYEVVAPIQFKTGEVFEIGHELPADLAEPFEGEAPKSKTKKRKGA